MNPEARLRVALVAAIRHAMESSCGYAPDAAELEESVAAGLAAFRGAEAGPPRPG